MDSKYVCTEPECSARFALNRDLKRHVDVVHGREERSIDIREQAGCTKSVTFWSELDRHIKSHEW